MENKKKPSELMQDVKKGMLLIDSFLIEHFEITEPLDRAKLCIMCMDKFGDLSGVDSGKAYELIVKQVNKK